MKKLAMLLVAVLTIPVLALSVYAAGESHEATMSGQMEQMHSSSSFSADDIVGLKVISQEGEELGKIKNAKVDAQTGRINFVTLSRGGVLGMGGQSIAIPLEALQIDLEASEATLAVDQSKLDNVPSQQAGVSDEKYTSELQTHYGVSPAWQEQEPAIEEESTPESAY